ncbi:MAG: hypothetical protein EAZ70_03580 [Runella slithyformis]|nr:MAG: hypothetical protein EAY79_03030 [Runella slithyformis]TAF29009.1 MAG: hypothetical protein EAZ70_03580 [Runella slithyformis]TAF46468.1 MAG: hypothetical protein EAZ63_09500 [Runella slithyformis]TAF82587.1 MAG: hypothetical protein EAZ50_03570 [Runella slithyformis]
MLMSFVTVESETVKKLQATKQVESAQTTTCFYTVSGTRLHGYHSGQVNVTLPGGQFISTNQPFSQVIPVTVGHGGTVTATVQSHGFLIRVNGAPMSDGGTTSIFFDWLCVFGGGNYPVIRDDPNQP